MEITPDFKAKAYRWCQKYLGGSWSKITTDEFSIQSIRGGLTNYLFMCSLPPHLQPANDVPSKILLRIYGTVYGNMLDGVSATLSETVIFAVLSERKLGPKLYGVFKEGRLEEFLPARNLKTDELWKPQYSTNIAREMAKFHKLTLPLCKEPTWLWKTLDRWLKEALEVEFKDKVRNSKLQQILELDLVKEYQWLRKVLESTDSPVCFCHNDFQEGNILLMSPEKVHLQVIDFEYCSYNYRGYDLANHFCEWVYCYDVNKPPYFTYKIENFPTKDQLLHFIHAYKEAFNANDSAVNNEEAMVLEIRRFALASHFLWGLWSILQEKTSYIRFGYMDYALARFDAYKIQKKQLEVEANAQELKMDEC